MDQTGARREVKGPLRRLQLRPAPGVIQQEGTAQPFPLPFSSFFTLFCPMFHPRAYLMAPGAPWLPGCSYQTFYLAPSGKKAEG